MTRYVCCVALLGIVALPDWASACRPGCWGYPVYYSQPVCPAYPVYPMYAPPQVYVYPPPYQPAPNYPLNPPRIDSPPKTATPKPAPAPTSGMGTNDSGNTRPVVSPAGAPTTNPVRPAGGIETIPATMTPVAPALKKDDPEAFSKFPKVEIPKSLGPLPKLEVPKEPDFRPIPVPAGSTGSQTKKQVPAAVPDVAPALDLPKDSGPKLPSLVLPGDNKPKATPSTGSGGAAVPSSAPAFPEPLIPPPSLPLIPGTTKTDSLPSLTLPPDTPIAPSKTDSTSRSSPLTGSRNRDLSVSVFPASSTGAVTGVYRTVGFYNHTERELILTIEGRTVKLPAKTYLNAKLAPTFTWSQGDQRAVRETVPQGASGVDVVFRSE